MGGKDKTDFGLPRKQKPKADITPEPWASTVVNLENIDRDDAIRISNFAVAIKNNDTNQGSRCRVETVYFEEELKMQILIWGNLEFTYSLLKIIEGMGK